MDDALDRFTHPTYTARRQVIKLFGGAQRIYDPSGEIALYSKLKSFRIREDIRLYTDESMAIEVLRIATKSILDISGAYDVFDSISNERVGALKRKGLKSIFKDEWTILDEQNNEIGKIVEDSTLKAMIRRVADDISFLLPQKYHAQIAGREVATYEQNFNPFVYKLKIDFSMDSEAILDRRLGLAAAVLLMAIEGKQ
jgi:uncharacterized protein YxjI